jgi:hypothetical protein
MNMPGFTAEASLSKAAGQYQMASASYEGYEDSRIISQLGVRNPPIVPDPRSCRWICDEDGYCFYHCGPFHPE